MSNMGYCRFQNTLSDLRDCLETLEGENEHYQEPEDLSDEEYRAMIRLIEICRDIIEVVDYQDCILLKKEDKGE